MPLERFEPGLAVGRRKFLLLFFVVSLCLAPPARAQSGRQRDKGTTTIPAPKDIAQPPADPPPSGPPSPVSSIIIAGDLVNEGYTVSKYVGTALKSCAERLKEHGLPEVTTAGSMPRQEAMERAKQKAGQYVVWLQIRLVSGETTNYISQIDYFVFTPQTAQLMFTGKVIPKRLGRGPVIMGIPTGPGPVQPSDQLKWAGRQIADLVNQRLQP